MADLGRTTASKDRAHTPSFSIFRKPNRPICVTYIFSPEFEISFLNLLTSPLLEGLVAGSEYHSSSVRKTRIRQTFLEVEIRVKFSLTHTDIEIRETSRCRTHGLELQRSSMGQTSKLGVIPVSHVHF